MQVPTQGITETINITLRVIIHGTEKYGIDAHILILKIGVVAHQQYRLEVITIMGINT